MSEWLGKCVNERSALKRRIGDECVKRGLDLPPKPFYIPPELFGVRFPPIRRRTPSSSPPTSRARVQRFPSLPPVRGPRPRHHRLRGRHHRMVVCRAPGEPSAFNRPGSCRGYTQTRRAARRGSLFLFPRSRNFPCSRNANAHHADETDSGQAGIRGLMTDPIGTGNGLYAEHFVAPQVFSLLNAFGMQECLSSRPVSY